MVGPHPVANLSSEAAVTREQNGLSLQSWAREPGMLLGPEHSALPLSNTGRRETQFSLFLLLTGPDRTTPAMAVLRIPGRRVPFCILAAQVLPQVPVGTGSAQP